MGCDVCVVCRRRKPDRGAVCEPCRTQAADLIGDLPRKIGALSVQLVPGAAGPAAGRVSTSKLAAPLPVRLDVLSLAGPGAGAVTAAHHPLVRRWSTQHEVTVTFTVAGKTRTERRAITRWHQELVVDETGLPVTVPDDDQIGALPPAEWLASWVKMWRSIAGHARRPAAPPRPARKAALDAVARQAVAAQLLGLGPARPVTARDPLADEWEIRFGEPAAVDQPYVDARYLLTWLDHAADQGDVFELAAFVAELRAVTAELVRVLGEHPDQQWLGRCPAQITETGDDPVEGRYVSVYPCGAGLWQDPYTGSYSSGTQIAPGQVECPRCHATWGPKMVDLLFLAKEIRRTWPVDRRRRYHSGDRETLRPPRCPVCAEPAVVGWRDVTEPGDSRRWWRPEKVGCLNGCPEAERLA